MRGKIQWLRRAVQISVILMVLITPFLVQYRVLLANNEIEALRRGNNGRFSGKIYLTIDRWMRRPSKEEASNLNSAAEREKVARRLENVRGNVWSAEIFGFSLTDPLGGIESIFASRTVTKALLIGMLIPVLVTLVLGRVFCSWICPAGFLFELTDKMRNFLVKLGIPLRSISYSTLNKYTLLVGGLAMAFFVGLPLLGYFYPPALLGREFHQFADTQFYESLAGASTTGPFLFSGALLFIFFIFLIEITLAGRMWCRYFCPGGALYAILGSRRIIRIANTTSACTNCFECIRVCPMGLNPMATEPGLECDNCLVCLTSCQPGSLSLDFPFKKIIQANGLAKEDKPAQKIAS